MQSGQKKTRLELAVSNNNTCEPNARRVAGGPELVSFAALAPLLRFPAEAGLGLLYGRCGQKEKRKERHDKRGNYFGKT